MCGGVHVSMDVKNICSEKQSTANPMSVTSCGTGETNGTLTLATDCSGLESPALILKEMGIPFRSLWVSETCEHALKFIRNNCEPERIDRDITKRDVKSLPKNPDIYCSGPPCSLFSSMNVKEKKADDPRREMFDYVLETIEVVKPKVFILENVRSVYTCEKGNVWEEISTQLDDFCDYFWDHMVLDPCKHGDCPQSRPRVYIVGLRKDLGVRHVPWPEEKPLTRTCVSLLDTHILEGRKVAPCYWRQLKVWGISEDTMAVIEPNGSSRSFSPYAGKAGKVKEITDSQRASIARTEIASCMVSHDPGPFVPALKRHCTVAEMFRLQGYDDSKIRVPPGLTTCQMSAKIGNQMNGAILRELLSRLVPLVQK